MPIDPQQLKMGEKVELEHTKDPSISRRIAMDHLKEIPDYYTRLEEMENKAKEEGKFTPVEKAVIDPDTKNKIEKKVEQAYSYVSRNRVWSRKALEYNRLYRSILKSSGNHIRYALAR